MQQVETHGGVIQRLGHMLTWYVDKELGSVLTTVQRQTEFLDSPPIMRNTSTSTFDPLVLRTGRATIYLCLPHDKLETLAPLMRMWIGIILRTITRGMPSERNPVLFFLDEAAHIGKIRSIGDAVTLMRGMGIRLWFFFQSLHQLQKCYGEKAEPYLITSTRNNISPSTPSTPPKRSASGSGIPRSPWPRMARTPAVQGTGAKRASSRAAIRTDGIPMFPTQGGGCSSRRK